MIHVLVVWLLSAVALVVAAYVLPGVEIDSFTTALVAALVIGLLNATIGFLLRLVVFPLTWLLPGLVYFIVDAVMIYVASRLVRGFRVKNFVNALLVALIVAVVGGVLGAF